MQKCTTPTNWRAIRPFVVSYFVRKHNDATNQVVQNLGKVKRQSVGAVTPVFAELNITDLPKGNYELVVEARNRKNEVLSRSTALFQRSKKVVEQPMDLTNIANLSIANNFATTIAEDSLDFYVRSLRPIATSSQVQAVDNVARSNDPQLQRNFLYNFWAIYKPEQPEAAFADYRNYVLAVENEYGFRKQHGFDTDRGRVYLQYGKPDYIFRSESNPDLLPYEIWQYYSLNGKTNVEFVFTSEHTGYDYTLIHSTARGEMADEYWKQKLKRYASDFEQKNTQMNNSFGRDTDDNNSIGGTVRPR